MTDDKKKKIEELLTRGVENIYPSKNALESALLSGKKLKLYNGIDPTGQLHIGHLVVLRKLRQFQDLGHDAIILIGDFTAQIGDPTDKTATRKKLAKEEVDKHSKVYKKLIEKILDMKNSNMRFLHNQEWTNELKPVDLLNLMSNFTVQQFLERDMFQERIKNKKEIYLSEFIYPMFQAYDAVTMDVDLQIGGNDQTFNMLAGRTLMKKLKNKEKFVLTTKLLTDPTGKKMGKSEGNIIALDDEPKEIFGKIMALPDTVLELGFELLTDFDLKEMKKMIKENPRDAKAKLAFDIVRQIHSESDAKKAQEEFERVFKNKENPEDMADIRISDKKLKLIDLVSKTKLAPSNSQARRLIQQGAVKVNNQKQIDPDKEIDIKNGMVVQVGKRRFCKIIK